MVEVAWEQTVSGKLGTSGIVRCAALLRADLQHREKDPWKRRSAVPARGVHAHGGSPRSRVSRPLFASVGAACLEKAMMGHERDPTSNYRVRCLYNVCFVTCGVRGLVSFGHLPFLLFRRNHIEIFFL